LGFDLFTDDKEAADLLLHLHRDDQLEPLRLEELEARREFIHVHVEHTIDPCQRLDEFRRAEQPAVGIIHAQSTAAEKLQCLLLAQIEVAAADHQLTHDGIDQQIDDTIDLEIGIQLLADFEERA